jgi:hypothetical protein
VRELVVVAAIAVAGCRHGKKPAKPLGDEFFTAWDDGHRVICPLGADRTHRFKLPQLEASLDRAAAEQLVLHASGHAPTIDLDEYAPAFQYAHDHGVAFVTYAQLAADRTPRAGWAFSIDDDEVDTWYTWRDRLRAWGVHLTFFVSHINQFTPAQLAKLHALAADGHDIEPHGLNHIEAKAFTAKYPIAQFLVQDIFPDLLIFNAMGFSTAAYAYPFGAHTSATDAALLPYFRFVRTTFGNCD